MALFSKDDKKKSNGGSKRDPKPAPKPPMPAGKSAAAGAPKGKPGAQPTQADIQSGLVKSQRALLALGEIVSVLMRSRQYSAATLNEVRAMAMPAITSGQFMVARAHSSATGLTAPVAMALWANVSEAVDRRLSQRLEGPSDLTPQEWTSGQIPWLITYVGDPRAINQMLEALQQKTLKGRPLKVRTKGKDGKTVVREFAPKLGAPKQKIS